MIEKIATDAGITKAAAAKAYDSFLDGINRLKSKGEMPSHSRPAKI